MTKLVFQFHHWLVSNHNCSVVKFHVNSRPIYYFDLVLNETLFNRMTILRVNEIWRSAGHQTDPAKFDYNSDITRFSKIIFTEGEPRWGSWTVLWWLLENTNEYSWEEQDATSSDRRANWWSSWWNWQNMDSLPISIPIPIPRSSSFSHFIFRRSSSSLSHGESFDHRFEMCPQLDGLSWCFLENVLSNPAMYRFSRRKQVQLRCVQLHLSTEHMPFNRDTVLRCLTTTHLVRR